MARKDVPDLLVLRVAREMWAELNSGPFRHDRKNLIERLMDSTGQCEKVCYSAAYRTADRGLIEYGVSIRWPWATPEGIVVLGKAK